MLIVNIVILLIFIIGMLISAKRKPDWIKDIDKKEHKLYYLYPLSELLLSKTGLEKILHRKNQITDSIKALYVTNKPELLQKLFWCSRISLMITVLILFNLLSLLGQLNNNSSSLLKEGKYILRPDFGEGDKEVKLNVVVEKEGNKDATEGGVNSSTQEVRLKVEERSYSQEELTKIMKEATEFLKTKVLGENASSEYVSENLVFCNTIPGTSITVDWHPKNYSLIQSDGTILNEDIQKEGVRTSVTAILNYREQQEEYMMSFKIMPIENSDMEVLRQRLVEEINESAKESEEEAYLELPDTLEQYHLKWEGKKENNGPMLLLIGVILAIVIWIFGDKDLEKQMKLRKEQMLLDYPEIINKFTLLVNAGMTVKQAWNKIGEDYKAKTQQKHNKKRYAYEEILTTSHELKLGLPENLAYEQYGRRIGLISYIKFGSLISQNLKKGNKGFTELLMKEAIEAFEDRKEIAKRLGEEAGTKLLVPMMLMLIIVFLMIMIPAFWSFRI